MRRRQAFKRTVTPDSRFHNEDIARLINVVMECGKKTVAQGIVYGALDRIKEAKADVDPVEFFAQALENVKPRLEVKSRRVGGATYQVPVEVAPERQSAVALRWIVQYARGRKGQPMEKALAAELMDAFNNTGNAVKKRDDVLRMAKANQAFAHYRW